MPRHESKKQLMQSQTQIKATSDWGFYYSLTAETKSTMRNLLQMKCSLLDDQTAPCGSALESVCVCMLLPSAEQQFKNISQPPYITAKKTGTGTPNLQTSVYCEALKQDSDSCFFQFSKRFVKLKRKKDDQIYWEISDYFIKLNARTHRRLLCLWCWDSFT